MSSMTVMLKIQVVFASPENQSAIDLEVREGTTIASAIEQSGLRDELWAVGIDIDAYNVRKRAFNLLPRSML